MARLLRTGPEPPGAERLVVNKAKLWLDAGHIFGACAEQFQQVVLACPCSTLQEALERLERAVDQQNKEI